MDFLPHGPLVFLVCLLTCTGGSTCPEVCTCGNNTLNCTNKFLTNFPALDGSFRHISFSRNHLTALSTSSMHLEGQSCTIDYSYNQLSRGLAHLSPDCQQLLANFSHNDFQGSLPSHFIFSNSGPNVTIDLSYNKLQRVEKSTFILFNSRSVTIDLSHNEINHIYPNAFEMKHLITTFHLNLSYNKIMSITQLTIYRFTTTIRLDLNDNLLTHVTESDINSMSQLRLNLARNPWSCDCNQSWIAKSGSKFPGILSNKPQELLCDHPPNMKDHPVLELSMEEFSCPPEHDSDANTQISANAGDTVVLNCPFRRAVPPVQLINWTFAPRAKLVSTGVISFSTPSDIPIQIHNVSCEWIGTYFCHVGNTGGDIHLNVTLSINSFCKYNLLIVLCVGITVLFVILTLTALAVHVKKTTSNSYALKTSHKDQLLSKQIAVQRVMLSEVSDKELDSTGSMKSEKENVKKQFVTNTGTYLDIISEESSEKKSHGKERNPKMSKFQSNANQGKTDCNNDATQISLITQTEEEQDLDQTYFSNRPLGPEEQGKKTNFNLKLPLAAKETENAETDEDMYLVPNTILKSKGPHLQPQSNHSGQNLTKKQTNDNNTDGIYLVPDQNLIPKTSGAGRDIPVYLDILPDKHKPVSSQHFETVKTAGLHTKFKNADNARNFKHKKKRRNLDKAGNGRGEMESDRVPRLMEEYIQEKHKQGKDEDGNEYFDVMQMKELCDKHSKEMNTSYLESMKEEGHCQEGDDLDDEMYLIPNPPQSIM